MSIRVITPPQPIMLPEEIAGVSADDGLVAAMIAAATAEIDGPDGWLGRCLGPQTLELRLAYDHHRHGRHGNHIKLPCPPLISVDGIKIVDEDGNETPLTEDEWGSSGEFVWLKSLSPQVSIGYVPEPIIITYQAGYDDQSPATGGTGPLPAQVKQAITLSIQYMRELGNQDLFLQLDVVEGVGRRQYAVSEAVGQIIQTAADRLLSGLRRFS